MVDKKKEAIELIKKGLFEKVPTIYLKDRDIVIELIKKGLFEKVPTIYWKDRDIVKRAIKESMDGLQFADESFQNDREIVLAAVKFHGGSFGYITNKEFLKDEEITLEALKSSDYSILETCDSSLLKNKQFMLKAVKVTSEALQFADEDLKKDPDIIKAALTASMVESKLTW